MLGEGQTISLVDTLLSLLARESISGGHCYRELARCCCLSWLVRWVLTLSSPLLAYPTCYPSCSLLRSPYFLRNPQSASFSSRSSTACCLGPCAAPPACAAPLSSSRAAAVRALLLRTHVSSSMSDSWSCASAPSLQPCRRFFRRFAAVLPLLEPQWSFRLQSAS